MISKLGAKNLSASYSKKPDPNKEIKHDYNTLNKLPFPDLKHAKGYSDDKNKFPDGKLGITLEEFNSMTKQAQEYYRQHSQQYADYNRRHNFGTIDMSGSSSNRTLGGGEI